MLTERSSILFFCLVVFHALRSAICQQDTVCYYIVSQSQTQTMSTYFVYEETCGSTVCYKIGTNVKYTTVMTYKTTLDCCQGHVNYPLCNAVCSEPCVSGECTAPNVCECLSGWTGVSCDTDINECEVTNGGCAHDCINNMGSYSCQCYHGYVLVSGEDFSHCEDVNECEVNNGDCEQHCTNTIGSFYCSCDLMYSLQLDGKTCLLLVSSPSTPEISLVAQPDFTSSLVTELLLATFTAIVIALVITVGVMIVICVILTKKDSGGNQQRNPPPRRPMSQQVGRRSHRPAPNNGNSSPSSPPPYTFIPIINPGYEIRSSIPAPSRMTSQGTDQNLASSNQGRNSIQLSSGVRRLNPLYETEMSALEAEEMEDVV